jgi:hypothetical protein
MHRLIGILSINLMLCIHLFVIHDAAFADASCAQQQFFGNAYDINTQKLLYQEQHQRLFKNDQLIRDQVEYRDTQSKVFAVKRVLYQRELSHPSFKLIDQRAKYIESAEVNNQKTTIRYQIPGKTNITQTQLTLPEHAVHDAGFNEMVQQNWLTLQNGQTVLMQFLAPSRASYLGFVITPAKQQTPGKLLVSLNATNKVFKWAIGQIDLVYDANTQQLLQFKGLTNIKNTDKKNYRARIDYVHQAKQNISCPNDLHDTLVLLR